MSASFSFEHCEHCGQHNDDCECLHCSECAEWIATAFYAADKSDVCGACLCERGDFEVDEDRSNYARTGVER